MPLNLGLPVRLRFLAVALVACGSLLAVQPASSARKKKPTKPPVVKQVVPVKPPPARSAKKKAYSPWRVPTYADSTEGDSPDGEDPIVRRAAVEALGKLNGTVVVSEAQTGRVLSIVNQKLAFKSGFQPCRDALLP